MPTKKEDLPAMPFYIGDWKKDPAVQVLDREHKMIWLDILFLMWESKERGYLTINNKPMSEIMIAGALNLDNQKMRTCLTYFEDLGLFSRRETDDAIYSRKIVKIVELSNIRKKAGSKGGNPNLVKQKLSKVETKGLPITENESESLNKDETINKIIKEEFENFWNLYNKKVGSKEKILKKFLKLSEVDRNKIFETLPEYLKSTPDKQYRKHPETYLNNHSWNDEIIKFSKNGITTTRRNTLQDFE